MEIDLTCAVVFQIECNRTVFMCRELLLLFLLVRSCRIVLCTPHFCSCTSCAHAWWRWGIDVLVQCHCFHYFSKCFYRPLRWLRPAVRIVNVVSNRRYRQNRWARRRSTGWPRATPRRPPLRKYLPPGRPAPHTALQSRRRGMLQSKTVRRAWHLRKHNHVPCTLYMYLKLQLITVPVAIWVWQT